MIPFLTPQNDNSVVPCIRCGYLYTVGEPSTEDYRVEHCSFCDENNRRMLAGDLPMSEPTAEFPTWKPDGA